MPELVLDPDYWRRRMETAPPSEPHHAIFKCPLDRWLRIEAKHRGILARVLKPSDSILDVGCGWGRLLTLLPPWYAGQYSGFDLAPTFIERARGAYPNKIWHVRDARDLSDYFGLGYDYAVMISFRPMVKRNLGDETWDDIESNVRRCAKKLLYLEYDETDEGSVE